MQVFRKSRPYTIVADDAAQGRLSHAYLLLCPDAKNLRAFLKELAKPVACDGLEPAARARAERLIDEEMYADCRVFPAPGEKCGVAEVRDLLGDCIVKPMEGRRKVFVLDAVQEMLAPAQNKLLKVLEEPPANVHFLLGSTNEFSVLPTVRSRVKKLELPAFSEADAEEYLRQKYPQRQDCRELAALSGGVLGRAEELAEAGEGQFAQAAELALTLSPAGIPAAARAVTDRAGAARLLAALRLVFRDMLMLRLGRQEGFLAGGAALQTLRRAAPRYTVAALLGAQDRIGEAERALRANANLAMCFEALFYGILEG